MELQDNDLIDMSAMIIENMFGEPGRKIFEYLLKNGYIAEERIATTLDVRSNEARKILQKLSDEAVVIPDRVKDEETGEVLHSWRFNKPALKTFILNRLKKTREKLEVLARHEREGTLYICKTCNRRYLLDEAYAYGFQCPNDGDLLVEANNPAVVKLIEESIKKIDVLISMIERM